MRPRRRWDSRRFRACRRQRRPDSRFRCSTTTGVADFKYDDASGVPTKMPPTVKRVIKGKVPRVDADGNELGGVPVVLRDAPLGTYLGWNVTADGLPQGQDLRLRRRHDSVREDAGRADGERRSATLARGALQDPRRLRRRGEDGRGEGGRGRVPAPGRCGPAARRRRGEQRLAGPGGNVFR